MHIIETLGHNGKLEGHGQLKMPPVSTAVAQRRDRKLVKQESLGLSINNKGKQMSSGFGGGGQVGNITESQKRIRAILDSNKDHSITSTTCDMDAIGSYTVKQPNTHRDLKSLDEMGSTNTGVDPANKLSSTMQQKIALEVTDRLYNKKKIKAMRK